MEHRPIASEHDIAVFAREASLLIVSIDSYGAAEERVQETRSTVALAGVRLNRTEEY